MFVEDQPQEQVDRYTSSPHAARLCALIGANTVVPYKIISQNPEFKDGRNIKENTEVKVNGKKEILEVIIDKTSSMDADDLEALQDMIMLAINDAMKKVDKMTEDTIFDIASMTKLYTEFVLFAFLEEYQLSLDTKLKELTNVYSNIEEMTILDLLEFKNTYRTTVDIRNCTNKKDAVEKSVASFLFI